MPDRRRHGDPPMIDLLKKRGAMVCVAAGATVLAVGLVGCSGLVMPAGGTGTTPGSGGATGAAGASTIPVVPCTDMSTAKPGRTPLRRLNLAEYARTVHDLLNVDTSSVTTTFPPDNTGLGFTNNADVLTVNSLLAEKYMSASEAYAAAAVANLTTLLPCNQMTAGEDACAKQFITTFGLRVFRRPLTSDENTTFFNLYATGKTGATFGDGIAVVI